MFDPMGGENIHGNLPKKDGHQIPVGDKGALHNTWNISTFQGKGWWDARTFIQRDSQIISQGIYSAVICLQ